MRGAVRSERLTASRDAPVGGQAVLEGVMMRGVSHWAVAVRKPAGLPGDAGSLAVQAGDQEPNQDHAQSGMPFNPDEQLGEIAVQEFTLQPHSWRRRTVKLPLLRGVVALWESLAIGMRALSIAANAQLPEDQAESISGVVWVVMLVVAMAFAVGIFFVVPVTLTNIVKHQLGSSFLFWLVEGVIRTVIFLAYLALLARARDLRRVLEYHGAEHKVISCYEAGDELTPQRAQLYSRLHPRCGTSFLLVVMIVSIFVFALAGLHAWWFLVLTRIVGLPVVIGISFEVIKWAGKNRRHRWVQLVMWPGLQLQRLTTREPDLDQLAVSIAALQAVLSHESPGELTAADLVGLEVVA